jgi:hypothetical protein
VGLTNARLRVAALDARHFFGDMVGGGGYLSYSFFISPLP